MIRTDHVGGGDKKTVDDEDDGTAETKKQTKYHTN